jgi:hypothetical protein
VISARGRARVVSKQRLILHVGRHKSGTSSLQHFLCQHALALAKEGAVYPVAGRQNSAQKPAVAHHLIYELVAKKAANPRLFTEVQSQFFDEIAGHDTIVVSSEGFQNLKEVDLLHAFFKEFVDFEVTVVMYLREYLSYLVSLYCQKIQTQSVFATFDDVSDACRRSLSLGHFFELWRQVGQVVYRPFDRSLLQGGDVIVDFLASIDMDIPVDWTEDSNPSIGGNLLFFKLGANRLAKPFLSYQEQRALASEYAAFRQPFFISPERANAIRRSSDYNDRVASVCGRLPEKSFDGYPSIPQVDMIAEDFGRLRRRAREHPELGEFLALIEDAKYWF